MSVRRVNENTYQLTISETLMIHILTAVNGKIASYRKERVVESNEEARQFLTSMIEDLEAFKADAAHLIVVTENGFQIK